MEQVFYNLQEKIQQLMEELRYYKKRFKIEIYKEKENETLQEQKSKAENILDITLQLKKQNDFCIELINEMNL